MPLWGNSDADESKPKNLTTAEKKEVYATASGWVREAGSALSGNNNTSADPELLVAVSALYQLILVLLTLLKLNGLQLLLISLLDLLYLLELDTMRLLQLLDHQHLQLRTETKDLDQVVDHTPLFMLVEQVLTN